MIRRLLCAAALMACAASTAAHAQPALPTDCKIAIFRISAVKPGKMATMEKAVRDQTAWYAAHNIPSFGKVVRILGETGFATDEVATVTMHPDPMAAQNAKHDAGWDAFVAEFNDASTIKQETRVCLPDLSKR